MNKRKVWYEIWIETRDGEHIKVARVRSPGLAHIVMQALSEHYGRVEIK